MLQVEYNGEIYERKKDESILSCLIRHGIEYPHSCQAGICQACLAKTKEKESIESSWQAELPHTLRAQGYFLTCLAKPKANFQLSSVEDAECDSVAVVQDIKHLNHNVTQIKLVTDNLNIWVPGQYIRLINSENVCRSYSIANIPFQEGYIELHVKRVLGGAMSNWLWDENRINTAVRIRGPFGKCYYNNPNNNSFDIVLAGTGTGLAPLVAIIKSAYEQNHQGKITLLHGGLNDNDIYYADEIRELAKENGSFHYDPCVLNSSGQFPVASIEKRILQHLNDVKNTQVYVCGPKEITNKLKRAAFIAGVSSTKIFSDAFV